LTAKDRPIILRPDENDDNLYHIDKEQKNENNNTNFTQTLTLTWNELNMLRDSLNVIMKQESGKRGMR
jgi:hypothetical protein